MAKTPRGYITLLILISIVSFLKPAGIQAAPAPAALDNRARPPRRQLFQAAQVNRPYNAILINNGLNYTTQRQVSLTLNSRPRGWIVIAIERMRFSNDNANWSEAEAYQESKQWALSEGPGQKTVYVQFADNRGRWGRAYSDSIIFDNTAPVITRVQDDGDSTFNRSTLHASWQAQEDASPITEYLYAIGSNPGSTDILGWASCGTNTEVTANNLALRVGQTYYFNLKARNAAGLESQVTSSDGITIANQNPTITSLTPQNNTKFRVRDVITITVQAQDADSDRLEYRYLIEGNIIQDWTQEASHSWATQEQDIRLKTIRVEVRDAYAATASQEARVFLSRMVPEP